MCAQKMQVYFILASTIQNKEDKQTSRNIAHFITIPKQIVFELFLSLAQIIMSWLNADMFASDITGYFEENRR